MPKDSKGKPTYEAPVVMPLGELAAGEGQATCQSGGTASSCNLGGNASNNCRSGTTAAGRCGPGGSPRCNFGFFG